MIPQSKQIRPENLKCQFRLLMTYAMEAQDIANYKFWKTCLDNVPEIHPMEMDDTYSKKDIIW